MAYTIVGFLKFGSLEFMKDLYDNGTIYLNTIEYYRKEEDNELRGDKYEGAIEVINSLPGKFTIPNVDRYFEYQKIHLKGTFNTVLGNIYSLYCISSYGFSNPNNFKIHEKNKRFGTHCVWIKDNQYFLNSIINQLKNNHFKFEHGFVEYYDKNTINKKITLFEKPNEFEYQKEFRFYVQNNKIEPISIKIGSIHGKAELLPIEDIINLKLESKNL